ncbi:two-component system response regulator YesN [Paenibacillus sp. V4I9]|uniref:response regulator transcription factor n=1 Tax=Paenibacillus sp. V4I9 TaxID=3042308 RepID=UPI002782404B|nr:response regulator [Paenibacillus sp. V4I9]MDQ0886313.1 two-component system response regulator YesN [Paenibacillus sp. V4I9]
MYSVLIVDDEPWVANGLKALIDWENLGYTVIGEAHDGVQAMAAIEEKEPDVVISDIRMPGFNGIQLLERIRLQGLQTKVILISGYAEFEYAQKALRLGAFDYLLKPVDRNKLTETLLRLKTKLADKHKANNELDLLLEDLFELLEPDNNIKISNFLTNRGIELEFPHCRVISCLFPHSSAGDSVGEQTAQNDIRWIRFRTGQNKMSYLVNYDEQKNSVGLLDFISGSLAGAQYIGISGIGVYSTPIGKLYQESDIALSSSCFLPEQRITEYKATDHAAALSKLVLKIELAIKGYKRDLIEQGLDELSEECVALRMPIDQISTVYNQIVLFVYKYYGNNDLVHGIEYLTYSQIVRTCESVQQLFERIRVIFEQQPDEELLISKETVKKIIQYIDSSYTEDISLSMLSRQFNISLGYLSALIKKETGTNYSDYVVTKRLNLAKELLSDVSLSIQEIVERVGYKDYFHFNKLFKKHFGITPSKHRKV